MLISLSEPIIYKIIDFIDLPEFFKICIACKNLLSIHMHVEFSNKFSITDLMTLSKDLPEVQFTIKQFYDYWERKYSFSEDITPILEKLYNFSIALRVYRDIPEISCIDLSNVKYLYLRHLKIKENVKKFFPQLKSVKELVLDRICFGKRISDFSFFFDFLKQITYFIIDNSSLDHILEKNSFTIDCPQLHTLVLNLYIDGFVFKHTYYTSALTKFVCLNIYDISDVDVSERTRESFPVVDSIDSYFQLNRFGSLKILKIGIYYRSDQFYRRFLFECVNLRFLAIKARWREIIDYEVFKSMKKLQSLTFEAGDDIFDQGTLLRMVNGSCPNLKELILIDHRTYIKSSNLHLLNNLKYIRKVAITVESLSSYDDLNLIRMNFKYLSHLCLVFENKQNGHIIDKLLNEFVNLTNIYVDFVDDNKDGKKDYQDQCEELLIGNTYTLRNKNWTKYHRFFD